MRSLNREKEKVYVSQPLPPVEIEHGGEKTGNFANAWDEPVELYLNVKPITDELERQAFGTDVNSILKAEFTPFDVDGYSMVSKSAVWIGAEPNGVLIESDPKNPANYNYTINHIIDTGSQITAYFKKVAGAEKA